MSEEALWWNLPGPRSFLRDIEAAVSAGKSAVLMTPPHTPVETIDQMRTAVRAAGLDYRSLEVAEAGILEMLVESYASADERPVVTRPRHASKIMRLSNTVILLRGRNRATAEKALAFLEAYERGQSGAHSRRPLFIVPLPASATPYAFEAQLATVISWRGRVSRADMTSFVSALRRDHERVCDTTLLDRIIVELAPWDRALAIELSTWDRDTLLAPTSALKDEALNRSSEADAPVWENGESDLVDGREIPCILHALKNGNEGEALRRVWRASIGELLPLIETIRPLCVSKVKEHLRMPHIDKNGNEISDPYDMEFGDLYFNLGQGGCPANLRMSIETLKRARDALAHGRALTRFAVERLEHEVRRMASHTP